MKSAAIVLRVSTQEQADSRLGLEAQLRLSLEVLARECPGKPHLVISDPGVSGSVPLAERKDGRRLVQLIAAGEVDVVVALTQDRLFRSMIDALATLGRWDELGVRVLLVDGGWLSMDDDEQWMRTVMNAFFAEMERRKCRKRTKRALDAAAIRGKRLGGVPYGSRPAVRVEAGKRVDTGRHVAQPDEQAVIERIHLLRAAERPPTYREIADQLQREGVPSRRGGRWQGETVRRIARRAP